ncbi:response regulator [Bradyrhizobium sp. CCGB12]|uniref:response regulator transcription factor n=1 Tax=Bradyrhizobium sp. CCGB12 TaxID=2949632 RepID=UPI0020B41970|nr:response regulator [Bradyrhizobium sp. CCGB12]MCP3392460.1 response regulator [Bradyrhizobium sp. CCGB12]
MISVVDDDASVRAAIENLLKSRGYIVHPFASAGEFLASPELTETSCVITDVQMPVMNGLELLAEIRARGHYTPCILITAFPDDRTRNSASAAGAIGFLAKPFAGRALIKCLKAALEEHRGGTGA